MKDKLKDALKEAMKNKDKTALSTVRSLMSAIQYEEMSKSVDELPAEAAVAVVKSEVKKRKESIEFEKQAGRDEECNLLLQEIKVLEKFLPAQLSEEELTAAINAIKEETSADNLGVIMKALKEKYSGQYDGKLASELARRVLGL